MATIAEKVKQIFVTQLGMDDCEVTPQSSIHDDFDTDSLDEIELIMAAEEAFDIIIPDEDAMKIRTVQQAIDYISSKYKPLTK
jgi:acyl carrier protein